MKLGAKSAPAPAEEPTDTAPAEEPTDDTQDTSGDDLDFSTDSGDETQDAGAEDTSGDTGTDDSGSGDKPFDDEPFDAGVEADEEEDPKKFIEQLTGKLGQSLRKYTEDKGEPDFELEKFAVNSLLSATHTGEMDSEDQKDIIKKVKKSGKGDENVDSSEETETTDTETTDTETTDDGETTDTETTDTETTDDSENMFETEMLDEMSLNDWKSKILIKIYDDNLEKGNEKILHILTRLVSFSDKINREEFLNDIETEVSNNEEMHYILNKLREMGIDVDSYEEEINYDKMYENAMILQNPKKNNMFQPGSNDILDEKDDRCTRIAKRKYDVWPSAYASGAVVKCRQGKIWKNVDENYLDELDTLEEKWSEKYKKSIDCNNPKGFSQKAHCQGRKKHE